jgi:hypothetical protein
MTKVDIHIQHNIKESKRDLEFSVGEHEYYYSFGKIMTLRKDRWYLSYKAIRRYNLEDSTHVIEQYTLTSINQNLVHFTCIPNKIITHPLSILAYRLFLLKMHGHNK